MNKIIQLKEQKIEAFDIFKRWNSPFNLTWVVMLMPTTSIFAPDVNTTSAASGSPYICFVRKLSKWVNSNTTKTTSSALPNEHEHAKNVELVDVDKDMKWCIIHKNS